MDNGLSLSTKVREHRIVIDFKDSKMPPHERQEAMYLQEKRRGNIIEFCPAMLPPGSAYPILVLESCRSKDGVQTITYRPTR